MLTKICVKKAKNIHRIIKTNLKNQEDILKEFCNLISSLNVNLRDSTSN